MFRDHNDMEAALGAVGELLAADDQSAALVIVGGVRSALLALKLFAAVDRGPRSVHMQDLLALRPTSLELNDAATWVLTQDAAAEFPRLVQEATDYVQSHS